MSLFLVGVLWLLFFCILLLFSSIPLRALGMLEVKRDEQAGEHLVEVTIPNLDDVRVTSVTSEMTSDRKFRF